MPITKLRYLKRNNINHSQNVMKNYYYDLINSYGVDLIYFRKDLSFYDVPSGLANYTYGEDSTATYYLSGNVVAYMEMLGDSFLLNKFGIQTDGDASIYFSIEQFNEQFRDQVGTPASGVFSSVINANIVNYSGIISGEVLDNDIDLSGITSANLIVTSGSVSGVFSESLQSSLTPINPDIKLPSYYETRRVVDGNLSGVYSGVIDASGNGTLSGNVSGILEYFITPALSNGPSDNNISPRVGDFFRMTDFQDDNHEEYEISRIYNRNLQDSGLNPLLGSYIFKCDVLRRTPSHESININGVEATHIEEEKTVDKLGQNTWEEDVSNEIFNYSSETIDDVDGVDSDDVYGGYNL